jgi:hypothetical protein
MPDGQPEPKEKELDEAEAAYHEAGHCYVAAKDTWRLVDHVRIFKQKKGWSGTTGVQNAHEQSPSVTTIAVAGLVTEAKFVAIQKDTINNQIHISVNIVEHVEDYVKKYKSLSGVGKKGRQIDIPILPGMDQVAEASISEDDAKLMPSLYRNYGTIKSSLEHVTSICNTPAKWAMIDKLAKAIMAAKGRKLHLKQINHILNIPLPEY